MIQPPYDRIRWDAVLYDTASNTSSVAICG